MLGDFKVHEGNDPNVEGVTAGNRPHDLNLCAVLLWTSVLFTASIA